MKLYYKIIEVNNEQVLTLFHGINGTRVLPYNKWVKAEVKENVIDGKGSSYTSGIHVIDGLENVGKYMKRFKRKNRAVVACYARGLRHKEKSKDYVFLADEIKVIQGLVHY